MHQQVDVYPSAQRTATPTAFRLTNRQGRYGRVVIDVTSINAGTPSITVTVKAVDRVSGKKSTVLASAALGAVATTVLKIGPALTAAANAVANDVLPPDIEIESVHTDAQPINYSIGLDVSD